MGDQGGSSAGGNRHGEVRSPQRQLTDTVGDDVDDLPGSVHLTHPIQQTHGYVMSGNDPRTDNLVVTAGQYVVVHFEFLAVKIVKIVNVVGNREAGVRGDQFLLLISGEICPLRPYGEPCHERHGEHLFDYRLELLIPLSHGYSRACFHGLEQRIREGLHLHRRRVALCGIHYTRERKRAQQQHDSWCHESCAPCSTHRVLTVAVWSRGSLAQGALAVPEN